MQKSTFKTNYNLLIELGIFSEECKVSTYRKSTSEGFMDLIIERNTLIDDVTGKKGLGYSLAHYFELNGDLCSDPVMEIIIYPTDQEVEVYSYQLSLPPTYSVVYPSPGMCCTKMKDQLNYFLGIWLKNLKDQGHCKTIIDLNEKKEGENLEVA